MYPTLIKLKLVCRALSGLQGRSLRSPEALTLRLLALDARHGDARSSEVLELDEALAAHPTDRGFRGGAKCEEGEWPAGFFLCLTCARAVA